MAIYRRDMAERLSRCSTSEGDDGFFIEGWNFYCWKNYAIFGSVRFMISHFISAEKGPEKFECKFRREIATQVIKHKFGRKLITLYYCHNC